MNPTSIRTRPFHLRRLLATTTLLLIIGLPASAQQNPRPLSLQPRSAAPPAATDKPATSPRPAMSQEQALYLVRSTLLTLNDANRSGNYTVLRDLAAPDFQARNSAADLAQSFSDLRQRRFDLFAAALIQPQLTTGPVVDGEGRIRVRGFYPTHPLEISFDLTFQTVGTEWRLLAISISTPDAALRQPQAAGAGRK